MPHRHCVRWACAGASVEFETEPASDGVIFYPAEPTIVPEAASPDLEAVRNEVLAWLEKKFASVEVDQTPKAAF